MKRYNTMGIYRTLYPKIEQRISEEMAEQGIVHGSRVREFFIELARGRFAIDNHAEALLTELVKEGVLEPGAHAEPTTSQRAFLGLQFPRGHQIRWEPGSKESFSYSQIRTDQTSVQ